MDASSPVSDATTRGRVSVRSASIHDTSAILALGRKAFDELQRRGVPIHPDDNAIFDTLAGVIRHRFCFLAIDHVTGKAIGCIGAFPTRQWWSPQWTLQQAFWYVAPKHRRSKAGELLMRAIITRAREESLPVFMFSLDADKRNVAMQRFMRRLGFSVSGSTFVMKA